MTVAQAAPMRFRELRRGCRAGGDLHGKTSTLTEAQLADLVAFLESI